MCDQESAANSFKEKEKKKKKRRLTLHDGH